MTYNTCVFADGLRLVHLVSASPVVYCGYAVAAGTRNERPGDEGLAHFCEHMTFKGTQRRRAWHVLNCLESVGGDLNAYTTKETTVYHAAVLNTDIARAVDLLDDIVFHSTYPQAEIEKEVEVICDEIESYNDSPSELIYDLFENAVFAGHPLGHNILGDGERLRRYTTADALRFTREFYTPQRSVFFAYGDVDFRRLCRLLGKMHGACSPLPAGFKPSLAAATAEALPEYVPQQIGRRMDTHLAHVMVGCRAYGIHDERRMALYLLNNMLGGPGMNARLNLSLRERNALVYTVDSSMVSYSDTGTWAVYFGCDPKNVARCLRLVRRELDRVAEKPITETQLRAAKKQIRGQIGVACDSRESFALDLAKGFLHYGWLKDVSALCDKVDALTAADLLGVAREVFNPERLTVLTIR